ncbi:MAG: OB-fold nucleic acid binding domain-containing protein [Acidobacteria bacterium]|nr:OB-fold nucleic acid binding domain-containing protein [Acidobacteriota bacterium]
MVIILRSAAWLAAALALSTVVAACGSGPEAKAAPDLPASTQAASPAPLAPAAGTFTGVVRETMNSGGYTYVKLEEGGQTVWVAAMEFPVAAGERLTVPLESPMPGFTSRTLNRTFPLIYFVSGVARDGEPLPASTRAGGAEMAASHGAAPGGSLPEGAATTPMKPIAPPAGGMTIAEVWAKRLALGGGQVTVRGRVVKVNNGILGHNWIHLQDGSGSEGDRTNDLTVTTGTEVKMGDVVTATGILGLDRDFGAGYAYAAILESATVVIAQPAH